MLVHMVDLRVTYETEITCSAESFLTSPERPLNFKKSWTGPQEATNSCAPKYALKFDAYFL
jgi:hypothetical protein